jgi:hypothetical protein
MGPPSKPGVVKHEFCRLSARQKVTFWGSLSGLRIREAFFFAIVIAVPVMRWPLSLEQSYEQAYMFRPERRTHCVPFFSR